MKNIAKLKTLYAGGKQFYDGKDTISKGETVRINVRDKDGKVTKKPFVVKEITQLDNGGHKIRLVSKL